MIDSRDNTQDSITNHSYLKLAPLSSLSIRDPLVSATLTRMDVDADLSIQWICEAHPSYQPHLIGTLSYTDTVNVPHSVAFNDDRL